MATAPIDGSNDPNGTKIADFPKDEQYHYERGRALYRLGEPMPKRPYDEQGQELPHTQEEFYVFAGWMCARFDYEMKCRKVEDALRPDPHDPRPKKAA